MTTESARTLIIGMLGITITLLFALLGLAYRYGKVVNEIKNLAKSSRKTANAIDRHIAWHMRNNPP